MILLSQKKCRLMVCVFFILCLLCSCSKIEVAVSTASVSSIAAYDFSDAAIQSIYLQTGSSSGLHTYQIERTNQTIIVKKTAFDGGEEETTTVFISESELAALVQILEEYHVENWNGYSEAEQSEGGSFFLLEIAVEGNEKFTAQGENCFPEDFLAFEDRFLTKLDSYLNAPH